MGKKIKQIKLHLYAFVALNIHICIGIETQSGGGLNQKDLLVVVVGVGCSSS